MKLILPLAVVAGVAGFLRRRKGGAKGAPRGPPKPQPLEDEGPVSAPATVALYGLSADPPTGDGGHMGVVKALLAEKGPSGAPAYGEVWVVPVYGHRFADKAARLAPYEARVGMCRVAFGGLGSRVRVSLAEKALWEAAGEGEVPGTADLIKSLSAAHPSTAFTFVMGADGWQDVCAGKWKDGEWLRREATVAVVGRAGVVMGAQRPAKVLAVPGLDDTSSSKARDAIRAGDCTAGGMVDPTVAAYVAGYGLYGA